MIRRRMCNVVECFAGHRDHMQLAKFELLGCLETERKALRRPTENSLSNLAPLRANGNFSTNCSRSVSVGVLKLHVNIAVRAAGGLRPGFNFNQFSLSFPESERYGAYVSAEHKVFGDQMVVYADGFYRSVKTHNELAAPATGSFQTKGQTILAIPPNSPIAPGSELPNTPTHAETGVPADAFNPFNPFDQIISGGTRARLAEFGNRLFDNETDAWLSTLGIKGDKLFDGSLGGTTPGSATVRSRILRLGHKCPPRGSTAS